MAGLRERIEGWLASGRSSDLESVRRRLARVMWLRARRTAQGALVPDRYIVRVAPRFWARYDGLWERSRGYLHDEALATVRRKGYRMRGDGLAIHVVEDPRIRAGFRVEGRFSSAPGAISRDADPRYVRTEIAGPAAPTAPPAPRGGTEILGDGEG